MASYEFGELPGSAGHVRVRQLLGVHPTWLPEDVDDIPEAIVCATTYEGYRQFGQEGPKRRKLRVGVPGGDRISFDKKCSIFFSWRGSAFQVGWLVVSCAAACWWYWQRAGCKGFTLPRRTT
jgi:hypothetical protein